MSCGCPVVCSNAASLPEVTGDAALCCPPGDEKQMADHCLAILNDDQLAERLMKEGFARARCFSLERMGNQLLGVYMNVVGGRK
jgi:glycosyltransferase involved in cell wall biosynthesis